MNLFLQATEQLHRLDPVLAKGSVTRVAGSIIESSGPNANLGDVCWVHTQDGSNPCLAEVVGFRQNTLILMPLKEIPHIGPGSMVSHRNGSSLVSLSENLVGRVINAMGEPIDGQGPIIGKEFRAPVNHAPHPLRRKPVNEPLETGVRAIDGFLTIGRGQRIGIMAGSGVGKSVLLGMIAKRAKADINVIALIGERGREVAEFLTQNLGDEGLRKSVVVVATSDEMPLLRKKGALLATTIAEYFRDQGYSVILMMDSLTRVAMAQREIGLAVGEPPTTRGYTPSTFSFIPMLAERAGNDEKGSITGIYTVLVEGDDMNEPVADTARGTLDGHIILSRDLAAKAHYPAIDILQSTSRVMPSVVQDEHLRMSQILKELIAVYHEAEDLVNIGAYNRGSNRKIDLALDLIEGVNSFLKQGMDEFSSFSESLQKMKSMTEGIL